MSQRISIVLEMFTDDLHTLYLETNSHPRAPMYGGCCVYTAQYTAVGLALRRSTYCWGNTLNCGFGGSRSPKLANRFHGPSKIRLIGVAS